MHCRSFATLVILLVSGSIAVGRDIYVDNLGGFDGNDGLTSGLVTELTGPVRSIRMALKLARRGDRIVLRKTSQDYAESFWFSGGRHSGFVNEPFILEGNGATISGVASIPSDGWQSEGQGLWRLSFTRKGYYRFFRNGQPISEAAVMGSNWQASDIPDYEWATRNGAVFFRIPEKDSPFSDRWSYAAAETGISLVNVENMRIQNLNLVGFRVDGVNADGRSQRIVLDNVTIQNNGRAGVAVGNTSQVQILNSRILENGKYSVLVTEKAGVTLEGCDLGGVEPTLQVQP